MKLPLEFARIGIAGGHPARPLFRVVHGSKTLGGTAPRLTHGSAGESSGGDQFDRRAPIDFTGKDQVVFRIERRAVPLGSALRTGAKSRSPGGHRRLDIRHRRDLLAVYDLAQVEVDQVQVPVFRRLGQHAMADSIEEDHRRARNVPIVKIALHQLKMALVGTGFCIEYHDGTRVQVFARVRLLGKIRCGVAARHVQQAGDRIQGIRSPGCAARDGNPLAVLPRSRGNGRGGGRSAGARSTRHIGRRLRHHVKLPNDAAALGVEGIHASLDALIVAAGIADENHPVPRDG